MPQVQDFFPITNGYLVILPSGQRVGINITPDLPTALDIGGRARVRNFSALATAAGVVLHDANGVLQTSGTGTTGQFLSWSATDPVWTTAFGPTGAQGIIYFLI